MTTGGARRFEELGPQEVLALAINIEQSNARRFRAFASVFAGYDDEVVRRFEELAVEEEAHEQMLVETFNTYFDGPMPAVDETDIDVVIECHDLDDAETQIFSDFQPVQCYELALRSERAALDFYRRAATACSDERLARLYGELAELEAEHESWCLERIRAEGGKD